MNEKEGIKSDLTFIEACNLLKKSKRTISRYIKKGLIIPEKIKSQKGSIEYRFKKADIESLKISGMDKIRQDITEDTRQAMRQDTGQSNEVIILLKETTKILRDQLAVKDKQIKSLGNKLDGLIERGRETNILIKGLTNKVLMLEGKTDPTETEKEIKKREDRPDKVRQDRGQKIKVFFKRLFKGNN